MKKYSALLRVYSVALALMVLSPSNASQTTTSDEALHQAFPHLAQNLVPVETIRRICEHTDHTPAPAPATGLPSVPSTSPASSTGPSSTELSHPPLLRRQEAVALPEFSA